MVTSPYECVSPSVLYDIQECVGRGNFGDVYRASERSTKRVVAIKVVNLEHTEEEIELLAQEIFFLAELRSPYITNYIATMVEDVSMWIVMEYCGGGSCSDLIKTLYPNGLPESKVAFISREVLKGLKYLHEQKKIHRDIKAANILLNDDGMIKLGDFGVSGQIKATTKRGTFVGTPYWMAPEVACKFAEGYNEKVDIWSLGITVYELLKGSPPLSKCDPMKVIANLGKRRPPKLHGNYTDNAKEFVASCLIKNPATRPSASDLLNSNFVLHVKEGNLRLEVEMVKSKKASSKYSRTPKFPLGDRLYSQSEDHYKDYWDFRSHRTVDKQPRKKVDPLESLELTPKTTETCTNTPLTPSSNLHSPCQREGQGSISPITNATTPSFRNYNKQEYELGSGMDIDIETQHDNQEFNLKEFDYLKNVISYSFTRMHDRARDEETRTFVNGMLETFTETENNVPGFSEVFIEEISLRMNSIKKYLEK